MRPLSEAAVESRAGAAGSPAGAIEDRESTSEVLCVLATLPDKQQEVIRLRFQNGLSYREISSVTALSVSNVGYLLHTAIKTIREKLAPSLRSD